MVVRFDRAKSEVSQKAAAGKLKRGKEGPMHCLKIHMVAIP